MPERKQKPPSPAPFQKKEGDEGGPSQPNVNRPDNKELLERMRKVDPNQSKRYRQRTGQ
ncbi:MAG: ubiquitin-like protein UBact [Verrucomicrobiae bacterium]|nr:ubiquitin-like protein UBact [Verrucomicrobiae bacterium]